jgi:predicted ArsR family transcriptional regulator
MSDDIDFDDELTQSRSETRGAFENRALMYAYLYEELADELGPDRATELMKRAIHRRGLEVGRKYRPAAHSRDLDEVGRIFCETSPAAGELFEPGVEEQDEERIVLRMTACPLVDAWRAAGLDVDEIDHLCEIAAAVDEGTFEGAGLELTFLDRIGQPGSEHCLLELRLP